MGRWCAGCRALAALAILFCAQQAAAQAVWTDPLVPGPTNGGLFPTFFDAYGQQHVYQLAEAPVGTVVLIHGCGRVANSFWPYDPINCPQCEGLPEHVAQTKQALAMGYSVLALSPNNAASKCWSSSTRDGRIDDRIGVADTVYAFQQNNSLLELPLFFYAFSSGGTMCLKLPTFLHQQAQGPAKQLRIDGIVSVDAAPSGGTGATDDDGKLVVPYHPPVLHVVMEKGKSRQRAPALIKALQDNGVPAELVVSYARKVGPSFFSDRIPTMTVQQSEALVAALRELGQLDEAGNLLFNPDRSPWYGDVLARLPWLGPQMAPIQQEMRVIWGEHENLGDFTTASLAWLESEGKADLPTLLRELTVDRLSELTVNGEAVFGVASEEAAPAPVPAPAPAQS